MFLRTKTMNDYKYVHAGMGETTGDESCFDMDAFMKMFLDAHKQYTMDHFRDPQLLKSAFKTIMERVEADKAFKDVVNFKFSDVAFGDIFKEIHIEGCQCEILTEQDLEFIIFKVIRGKDVPTID